MTRRFYKTLSDRDFHKILRELRNLENERFAPEDQVPEFSSMSTVEKHNMYLTMFLGRQDTPPFKTRGKYVKFCDKERLRLMNLLQERGETFI